MPTPKSARAKIVKTTMSIRYSARKAAHRISASLQDIKDARRQQVKAWQQAEAKWQQRLSTDLDAAIGKLTYNDAFTKYGQPQVTIMNPSEVIAIYQNGRLKFRWFPMSNQAMLACFPHGSRLELIFNATTKLVSWKYTEW
jgi:hypothetical protein